MIRSFPTFSTVPSFRRGFRAPCAKHVTPETSIIKQDNQEVQYKDSLTDMLFIGMCRKAYGALAGWQSDRGWWNGEETYKGMVEVSRALMKGKTAAEQQEAVIAGFPEIPDWFRKIFPYTTEGAEINARLTLLFFTWLVGPVEITEAEVDGIMQKSNVHIKQCRYLYESKCVGMCTNLCKAPCQTFFTEQLGMPLTMTPSKIPAPLIDSDSWLDFEDFSCEMTFGARPPPLSEDPVYQQSCIKDCPTSQASNICWKVK